MIAGLHYLHFTKPDTVQPQSLITQISSFSSLKQREAWVYHLEISTPLLRHKKRAEARFFGLA